MSYKITQRQKNILLFSLLLLIAIVPVLAQSDGLNQAADKISTSVNGVATKMKKIGFSVGTIFAVIAAISKYMKTGTDSENTGKAYTSWFVGIMMFSLAMGVIGMFMQ